MATGAFWAVWLLPAGYLPRSLGLCWVLGVGAVGVLSVYAAWTFSPWVPTPRAEHQRVIDLLGLGAGELYIELGSGDGSLLVEVGKRTGARCLGVEISPPLWALAKLRMLAAGTHGRVVLGDLHAVDLSGAAAVYVWGTAHGIQASLVDSLAPGAVFVSRAYPLPGREPDHVDLDGDVPLYVYEGG